MAIKGRSTQSLANTFPLWTNLRTDEQSLAYQFLNIAGKSFDDLHKQVDRLGKNHYLPTSIVSDIDVFYQYKLPGDYEFAKEDDDNTEFVYTPPTVSGYIDENEYSVEIAANNDIESFWYTVSPDRISLEQTIDNEHFLASGFFNQVLFSPPSEASGLLHIPNKITIEVDDGISFVEIEDNNQIRKTMVQIEGLTREGNEVTEELIFTNNETQQTYHDFKYVKDNGLRVFGTGNPESSTIKFSSANFNATDYSINYELDTTVYGEDMPLFWGLGSGVSNDVKTLDLKKYDTDSLELRIEGFTEKHTIIQQELKDTSGNKIIPSDLTIEPNSDNIWVVSSGTLYLYDSNIPFSNLSTLQDKDYNANSTIEPNTYYATIDEEIELNYIWNRPTTGFICHRVWVKKPDGTKKSLENGVEITYHTDSSSWIFGEPVLRKIRPSEFYTLDQYGDYIYTLEARYTDETSSIDKRVISVLDKQPKVQFDLSELGITTSITGVDFDSEEKLWILDTSGTKYQIERHWDKMIIDFKRKILYFHEPYDKVRVY